MAKPKRAENVVCKSACDLLKISFDDISYLVDHFPQLLSGLRKLDRARQPRLNAVNRPLTDAEEMVATEGRGEQGEGEGGWLNAVNNRPLPDAEVMVATEGRGWWGVGEVVGGSGEERGGEGAGVVGGIGEYEGVGGNGRGEGREGV